MIIFIATCFFFFCVIIVFSILNQLFNKENLLDRLNDYDHSPALSVSNKHKPSQNNGPIKKISKIFNRTNSNSSRRRKKVLLLKQSNVKISYEELLVIKIMSSITFGLFVLLISKDIFISILIFVFIWSLPDFILKKVRSKRVNSFDQLLTEALVMVSNALKAGYSFLQSLAVAAEEAGEPLSSEFRTLLKELSLGMSMEEGFSNFLERMPSDDLKLIVNAILIQKDIGGNLSEILENISETIRDRQQIKNEVKSLTAQGRLSGIIIMVMPFFLGLIIYIFDSNYITTLFTSLIGRIMIIVALTNEVIGWLFIRKIIRIDY